MSKNVKVHVCFQQKQYNYTTSVNPDSTDQELKDYFVGKQFNLGQVEDNLQTCIRIEIYR